jgi:hypothetical protein
MKFVINVYNPTMLLETHNIQELMQRDLYHYNIGNKVH